MTNSRLPLTETIMPPDAVAVAASVAEAKRAGAAVYPIGGGGALDYGGHATRTGVGLSLEKLNRVVDHPARDLTITVEAGVTIAALQKKLAAEHQRLPVDIPQPERATIGGVVATSPSGPRRYRWGTVRDYVIGATAVDGTGTVFHSGGRVVKNAAGYNLCRLLTGSLGTLGVVTQVTLMVRPMPEVAAVIACDLGDFDTAERLLAALAGSETLPVTIEWLAGPAWGDDPALGPIADGAVGRLLVGFEGAAPEVDWMLETLAGQWNEYGVPKPITVASGQVEPLYARLAGFPVRGNHEETLVVQCSVLPSATLTTARRLREVDSNVSIEAHAGNGVLRCRFEVSADAAAAMVRDRVRPLATQAGGVAMVLAAPEQAKLDAECVWGPSGEGQSIMQAIKDRFDPANVLNPDRFIFT